MLYNWQGKAYRSKQCDIAVIEVQEVLDVGIFHDPDGHLVFDRDYIDGIPLHKTEGFEDHGQMQEWFSKVIPIGETMEFSLMRFRVSQDSP